MNIGIAGAGGRFATAIADAGAEADVSVVYRRYRDRERLDGIPEVLVEASHRDGVRQSVDFAKSNDCALVVTVSGMNLEDEALLESAARDVAVLVADNCTYGHYIQSKMLRDLVQFGQGSEHRGRFSIQDRHPATKRDTPSRTAIRLSRELARRGVDGASIETRREGAPVCDHVVSLAFPEETIEIGHSVFSLRAAAEGVLLAAAFLRGMAPGSLYRMEQVYDTRFGQPSFAGSNIPQANSVKG